MDLRTSMTFALAVAGIVWSGLPALSQTIEEDVTAAYAAWDAASFNARDAEALAGAYTEDALVLPSTHDVIKGPQRVAEFFGPLFEMGVTGHGLELIEARDAGGAVVAAAKWTATGKDDAGADQPWSRVTTHVFERQEDGSLKVMLHTFN